MCTHDMQLRLELFRVRTASPVQLYWLDVYSKYLHLLQYRRGYNIACCLVFVQHLIYSIFLRRSVDASFKRKGK